METSFIWRYRICVYKRPKYFVHPYEAFCFVGIGLTPERCSAVGMTAEEAKKLLQQRVQSKIDEAAKELAELEISEADVTIPESLTRLVRSL